MASNSPFVFGGAQNSAGQPAPSFPSTPLQSIQTPTPQVPVPQQNGSQQGAQMPGIDMSALAGVSPDQVALIARLLQSGALPLPPPPPPLPPPAPAQAAVNVPPANSTSIQPQAAMQEDVDMDKEEGEIEDVEPEQIASPPVTREVPKGPRNLNARRASRQGNRVSQAQIAAAVAQAQTTTTRKVAPDVNVEKGERMLMAKENAAKSFVLAMHQAGYSYRQLAENVDDPKPLRRMFKVLGLPVSSDHGLANGNLPPKVSSPQAQAPTAAPKVLPPAEPVSATPVAKQPTQQKPAVKPDRGAYLAKLQALKAGKSGSPTTQAAAQGATPVTPGKEVPPSQPAVPPTTAAPVPQTEPGPSNATPTPASKAVKTELARQRLEAFKAERAAKQQAMAAASAATAATTVPSPTTIANASPATGLGAGLSAIPAKFAEQTFPTDTAKQDHGLAATQATAIPPIPTPSRSFSGLPGLFMNDIAQMAASAAPVPPARTVSQPAAPVSTLPQKRLVIEEPVGVPTPKRPFGQSRSASEDESFIIENSDDEDGDAHMTMDTGSPTVTRIQDQNHFNGLQNQTSFASGTSTPGGVSYEQKLKAIEEIKRKIAEKEAKRIVLDKPPVAQTTAVSVAPGLPGLASPSPAPTAARPAEQDQQIRAATSTPGRSASLGAVKLTQQKEELRQRLAELESAKVSAGVTLPQIAEAAAAASHKLAGKSIVNGAPAAPLAAAETEPVGRGQAEASEDGEVEDESDFDFYGEEDVNDGLKPSPHDPQVDSQATTVSEVNRGDHDQLQNPTPSSVPTTLMDDKPPAPMVQEEDEGTRDELVDGPSTVAALESSAHTAPSAGVRDKVGINEPATALGVDEEDEMSMDESGTGSEDSSDNDDDGSDLNGASAHPPATAAPQVDGFEVSHAEGVNAADEGVTVDFDGSNIGDHVDVESSDAASTSSSDSEEYEPEQAIDLAEPEVADEADDQTDELQPSPTLAAIVHLQQPPTDTPKTYYTPYESILKKFKDYRYHPNYLTNVPSGFRSLTWNHQIDPDKPLCLTEASGAKCSEGKACGFQHFDEMALSDTQLLQQMGAKSIPARTKEEVERWNTGLRAIVQLLKAANVKDGASIAARIAEYRREFVGDPTTVVVVR